METKRIHFTPEGMHIDKFPDEEGEAFFVQLEAKEKAQAAEFQNFVDTTPNLNNKYEADIAQVKNFYLEQGLEVAPIVVLNEKNYLKARRTIGEATKEKDTTMGLATYGRVIVREEIEGETIPEAVRKQRTLGIMLHEAAHSTSTKETGVAVVSHSEEKLALDGLTRTRQTDIRVMQGTSETDFTKPKISKGSLMVKSGTFIDEGYADYQRVKGLEALDQEPKSDIALTGDKLDGDGIGFYNQETHAPVVNHEHGTVALPLKYALAAGKAADGSFITQTSSSGTAGYGIELLEKRQPGLIAQMNAARNGTGSFKTVIQRINEIRPGLYGDLRELSYNTEDFKTGLGLVVDAVQPEV